MPEKLEWLLVGAGDIAGKRVAAALGAVAGSRLSAVCDLDRSRAEECAAKHGAGEVYDDFGQALERSSAGAVYVATPVCLHAPMAAAALASGRHVLVEKPLGVSAADARSAVAAAGKATALKAGCAYFRRCSPRYAMAREMLAAGKFGQVVLVRMTFFSWFDPAPGDPKAWRVVPEKSGGGPLADMGSHMFDLLIGLVGLPRSVFAKTATMTHGYAAEDSAAVLLVMPGGALATASFNWNSKTWAHEFELVGTEAKVRWFPCDSGTVTRTVGREITEMEMPDPPNVHQPLVEDFVAAVRDDRPPAVPLEEAFKTNLLLDAVYRSAESGREVFPEAG